MSPDKLLTIKEIATNVRRWAEVEAAKHPEYYTDDLCGFCAIAAGKLLEELLNHGFITAHISNNNEHCFCECSGYIIDVTATQYCLPEVHIKKRTELSVTETYIYMKKHVHTSVEKLAKHQHNKWPISQRVRFLESVA